MPRLRPIRHNIKGLLPGGLKRRPPNKTWRKGHRNKKGKWFKGRWVYRPGKARKERAKPKRVPKPSAKPKAKKAPKRRITPAAPVKRVQKPKAKPKPAPKPKTAPIPKIRPSPRPKVFVRRKPWSSERRRRARLVSATTGASVVQADALIRRAKSKGWDYDTVNWDVLQGKDLTFAGRVRRLNKMVGRTSTKREEAMDIAARKEEFREERRRAKRKRPPPGREEAARSRIEEEIRRRAEYMEQVLYGL